MVGSSSIPAFRRRLVAAMAFAFLLPSSLPVLAELAPTPALKRDQRTVYRDRNVAIAVRSYLNNMHLSRRRLDDEISTRAFESFVKQLDPMKIYFYQSDFDEFARYAKLLDDQVKRGDLNFSYQVFNRFLQRIDERVALVPKFLEMEHDFTDDEQLVRDPDVATYPKTPEEAADRWRKRIKFDLLLLKDEEVEGEEAVDRLNRRYRSFAKRMKQYKPDDLLEMYLSAVTSSYDPHTTYMSPTTLENFNIQMKLNLEGIGAALSLQDGYTVVSRIIPGGAADKQGELKPEDRITSVGQGGDETDDVVDVVDMRLNDVVQLIRGKKGTIVRLGVISDGESKTVKIVRDRIELKDSEARGEVISSEEFGGSGGMRKANGAPYQIGVIKLPSFYMDMKGARLGYRDYKSTTRDVRRILADFKTKGIDAVVLDLRFNGGGSLTEAINLTGLFIDTGPVVQVKDSRNVITKYDDMEPGTAWDGPLAVITNKFSASASEILAGAVQDYKRGIVIGDTTTHGKGTVQSLMDISEKLFGDTPNVEQYGAIKITMQQFYRPNGDSTQRRGVLADIPLPSTTAEMDIGEADLDYAVKFDTVPMAEHRLYNMVRPDILNNLKTNVKQRIESSEDFAKELRRIERYKEQKERDYVSLNEEEFFARRKELNADKEDEETFKEIDSGDEDVLDLEDFYNREIINITLDYVGMLNGVPVASGR